MNNVGTTNSGISIAAASHSFVMRDTLLQSTNSDATSFYCGTVRTSTPNSLVCGNENLKKRRKRNIDIFVRISCVRLWMF